ncbi:hypothetical protein CAPTEDRAFT_77859, partial [Capitella teleta]
LIGRRGATIALGRIVQEAGESLPSVMSHLWESMTCHLSEVQKPEGGAEQGSVEDAQELVNSLQVLQLVGPKLHPSLIDQLVVRLPALCSYLFHPYTSVRHLAARCLAMLCRHRCSATMNHVLEEVVPAMGASESVVKRQGGVEALSFILEELGVEVIPYAVLLVVPVLGRMSDQDQAARLMATHCFASLIRLMPLESGIPDPPLLSAQLVKQKEKERHFLEQLLDGNTVDDYRIPVPIKADLRKYQQDGVNWLSFLNRYKLHGILCDDMGLGKTLMSLCILAGDHFLRAKAYEESEQADSAPLPSIVICPPTLTGHWVYEVEKFVASEYLNPLHYTGCPAERYRLQKNNVLELWSLFDFLMPGFLGTERQFAAKYGRPILQSRDAKSSSKEQEAGARAMEALHRQVLPFLLRRLKENVL